MKKLLIILPFLMLVASVAFSVDNSKLMMVGKDQTVVVRNLHF